MALEMSSREDRRKARAERQAQRRAERGPRKARAPRAEPEPEPPAPVLRWFDGAGELVTDPEPPTVLQQATRAGSNAAHLAALRCALACAQTMFVCVDGWMNMTLLSPRRCSPTRTKGERERARTHT